jgi:hypothetical protein
MPSVFDPPFGYVHAFLAYNNPNLSCIEVDNVAWSTANWPNIDSTAFFSLNCSGAGISDINESNSLMLYPNPTNGEFIIDITKGLIGEQYVITDFSGKIIKFGKFENSKEKVDIDDFSKGVFIIQIKNRNIQERIIKL